jgi:hypothetical protein
VVFDLGAQLLDAGACVGEAGLVLVLGRGAHAPGVPQTRRAVNGAQLAAPRCPCRG